MRHGRLHTRSLAPLVLGLSVWLVWPVQAFARSIVRFIHGVPGVGAATLAIDGHAAGSIAFGQVSRWQSLRTGRFTWTLSQGSRRLAAGTATVGSGAYDIVVLERSGAMRLGIYRAHCGRSGSSLIRVIHGAPEFGTPALAVDGRTAVRSLAYTQATPYVALSPGSHHLAAMRPGTSTSLIGATVSLRPGVAYSAIVLGTRGQQVRVVEVVDRGAPLARRVTRARVSRPAADPHGATMVVARGESLWTIARRLAGPGASDAQVEAEVVAIWNRNVHRIGTGDPNLIFPGTRLRLPRRPSKEPS